MLKPGLYEQVINKDLSGELDESRQLIEKRNIDKAEASQVMISKVSWDLQTG